MEVTDSKAGMQSNTSEAWGRSDCHEVQDRFVLFCVYQAMRGYTEKLCLSDKKESSKGRREGGSEVYMESILVSVSAHGDSSLG